MPSYRLGLFSLVAILAIVVAQTQAVTAPALGGSSPSSAAIQEVLPFIMPSRETLQASPKKVVAHWHQWAISRDNKHPNSDVYSTVEIHPGKRRIVMRPLPRPPQSGDWKLKDAKVDIQWAQSMGLDGFMFNGANGGNIFTWPQYTIYLKAAQQLGTGFVIAPNLDCAGGCGSATNIVNDWVNALNNAGGLKHPNRMVHDGKFVFGSWNTHSGSASFWNSVKSGLSSRGVGPSLLMSVDFQACIPSLDSAVDMWAAWGVQGGPPNYPSAFANCDHELLVGGVSHGDSRYVPGEGTRAFETKNFDVLRRNWEAVINNRDIIDWAQLVTWNDIGEHSAFYPNTGEQWGFFDLAAYYIAWFKTGTAPTITQDALYYSHRKNYVPPTPVAFFNKQPYNNEIEVAAMTIAPATVEIITNQGTTRHDVGAGLNYVRAPLTSSSGRPRFRIVRNGTAVVDINSAFTISGSTQADVTYRAGGSMRTIYGQTHDATAACTSGSITPSECLAQMGEPVWMAN